MRSATWPRSRWSARDGAGPESPRSPGNTHPPHPGRTRSKRNDRYAPIPGAGPAALRPRRDPGRHSPRRASALRGANCGRSCSSEVRVDLFYSFIVFYREYRRTKPFMPWARIIGEWNGVSTALAEAPRRALAATPGGVQSERRTSWRRWRVCPPPPPPPPPPHVPVHRGSGMKARPPGSGGREARPRRPPGPRLLLRPVLPNEGGGKRRARERPFPARWAPRCSRRRRCSSRRGTRGRCRNAGRRSTSPSPARTRRIPTASSTGPRMMPTSRGATVQSTSRAAAPRRPRSRAPRGWSSRAGPRRPRRRSASTCTATRARVSVERSSTSGSPSTRWAR